MNDKQRESLSAFLDGELKDPETIETLVRQSGCNKVFAAMCEQRDALHGQLNSFLPENFAERVATAVADEPAILSPAPARAETPVFSGQGEVVQGWFGGRAPSMAIAASVAALGFVGLVMFSESSNQTPEVAVNQSISAPVTLAGPGTLKAPDLSVRQEAVRQVASDVRKIDINSLSPQLREQLIQHIETARNARQAGAQQVGATPSNISFQPGN